MSPPLLYFIGGYNSISFSDKTQIFNTENNSWTMDASMPSPRAYLGLAVVKDVLYAIGGFDGSKWLSTVEEYTPAGYGTAPPIIQVTSPESNMTYSNVTLSFNTDRVTAWIGYSLDGQANVTIVGDTPLFSLPQGQNTVVIYANDSSGNMGTSGTIVFYVDSIAPNIVIIAPQNQSYGSNDIQLTFTLNKAAKYLAYSLDNGPNVSIIGNVTLAALADGPHSLTVYATYDLGNAGSETVYFNIAPFPTIEIAAVAVIIVIALASGYLFFKRIKPDKQKIEA